MTTPKATAAHPLGEAAGSRFADWMNRNHRGFFYGEYPCWNWKIRGVLVTLWLRTGLVKIYHDQGRATECHPAETERGREAIACISNKQICEP